MEGMDFSAHEHPHLSHNAYYGYKLYEGMRAGGISLPLILFANDAAMVHHRCHDKQ